MLYKKNNSAARSSLVVRIRLLVLTILLSFSFFFTHFSLSLSLSLFHFTFPFQITPIVSNFPLFIVNFFLFLYLEFKPIVTHPFPNFPLILSLSNFLIPHNYRCGIYFEKKRKEAKRSFK